MEGGTELYMELCVEAGVQEVLSMKTGGRFLGFWLKKRMELGIAWDEVQRDVPSW